VDRLFLDANVLFSAAYRADAGVARLWQLPNAVLLTSKYAVEEAHRNLRDHDQVERLNRLLESVASTPASSLDPNLRGDIQLPEKDWPILAGALGARATHLITGDVRDLGRYFGQHLLGILVVPPSQYLRARADEE